MHAPFCSQLRTDQFKISCMTLNKDNSETPEFPTFVPLSSNDRPPIHAEWTQREANERAALRRTVEDDLRRNPPHPKVERSRQWLLSPNRDRELAQWRQHGRPISEAAIDAAMPKPSLQALVDQQKAMFYEASVVDVVRRKNEQKHVPLLGRTEDLTRGALDGLLANARRIIASSAVAEETPPTPLVAMMAPEFTVGRQSSKSPNDASPTRSAARSGSFFSMSMGSGAVGFSSVGSSSSQQCKSASPAAPTTDAANHSFAARSGSLIPMTVGIAVGADGGSTGGTSGSSSSQQNKPFPLPPALLDKRTSVGFDDMAPPHRKTTVVGTL